MTTSETVTMIVLFSIAGLLMLSAVLHFAEKGFLFNNAYIFASPEKRRTMNKKPYYRQSAIVLFLLSLVFAVMGLAIALSDYRIQLLEIPLLLGAVVYAFLSSKKI